MSSNMDAIVGVSLRSVRRFFIVSVDLLCAPSVWSCRPIEFLLKVSLAHVRGSCSAPILVSAFLRAQKPARSRYHFSQPFLVRATATVNFIARRFSPVG
jgi:hypothetical protein